MTGKKNNESNEITDLVPAVESRIMEVRGQRVILSQDLAEIYGVEHKRFNQQISRNEDKFAGFAFKLTKEEFAVLRSQFVTSKPGRGGTRYPPWAFTEHGVVMAATVLNTEKAIKMSRLIVKVFVDVARRLENESTPLALLPSAESGSDLPVPVDQEGKRLPQKLDNAVSRLLDSVLSPSSQAAVAKESKVLARETLQCVRDHLEKQGMANQEARARIAKIMTEIETEHANKAKTWAEKEALEFTTNVRKLLLAYTLDKGDEDDIQNVLKLLSGL